jgi:hypothetical protein
MNDATLVVNDQSILLSDDADLRALIADMMSAVLAGGAFVRVIARHGRAYDILVNPATQVLISHGPITFETGDTEGAWASIIDLDL